MKYSNWMQFSFKPFLTHFTHDFQATLNMVTFCLKTKINKIGPWGLTFGTRCVLHFFH